VYGFSSADDVIADIASRVANTMQCKSIYLLQSLILTSILLYSGTINDLGFTSQVLPYHTPSNPSEALSISCWGHRVRDVAPKKIMVCLSFHLPMKVAMSIPIINYADGMLYDVIDSCNKNSSSSSSSIGSVKRSSLEIDDSNTTKKGKI
jgi:hypothetical protein